MVEGLFPRGEHAHLLNDLHRVEPRSGEALLIDDSEYLRVDFLVHAAGLRLVQGSMPHQASLRRSRHAFFRGGSVEQCEDTGTGREHRTGRRECNQARRRRGARP